MRARYSGSVHARATIWAPFAVIQASSACSVNSATKFFGMSAFRLSTIFSAAARFSGDAGASLFVSVMGSNSVGYARRATRLDAPSTLLLANVLDCLLGKGGGEVLDLLDNETGMHSCLESKPK